MGALGTARAQKAMRQDARFEKSIEVCALFGPGGARAGPLAGRL
jgi:hypothetical protein